jgi:hypothetical protein
MRKALLAAIATASAFTLAGCGLENIPYISPPGYSVPATPTNLVYTVNNPARDAGEVLVFRGFEVYYKFFNSDTQSTERNIQSGLSTRDQIVSSYSFHRMCTQGTQPQVVPFIPVDAVDRGTDFDILLDFSSVGTDSEATMTFDPSTVPPVLPHGTVRREATESGEPKSFAQERLSGTDDDMVGVDFPDALGERLDLVVYAISYGVQDYSPVYSTARCLGYMTYDF